MRNVLAVVLLVTVIGAGVYIAQCPCDRTPGTWLLGEEVTAPVSDWSFANEAALCQVELPGLIAHSVNLNCMAAPDGTLYLSCAQCEGKRWSTMALAEKHGRIRIGEAIYPVKLTRVLDSAELDRAWAARASKLIARRGSAAGGAEPEPRPEHWWSFRGES